MINSVPLQSIFLGQVEYLLLLVSVVAITKLFLFCRMKMGGGWWRLSFALMKLIGIKKDCELVDLYILFQLRFPGALETYAHWRA